MPVYQEDLMQLLHTQLGIGRRDAYGLVVTLATMVTWREALRWQQQGAFVNLPDGVQWFGLSQLAGQSLGLVSIVAGRHNH